MFDAGEGIQLALKRGGLGICSLDAVAISHLHADHVLGLPGIMMFRAQCDDPGPLTIIGPPGIERFVLHTIQDLKYRLNYSISFVEWSKTSSDTAWSWNGHALKWNTLSHSTFCLGYRIEEALRPGKFDLKRAIELGVPNGPLFGKLQNGKQVELEDGRIIKPNDVLGTPRRGRIVVFATDTQPCPGLAALCHNADLAFVEGMFAEQHAKEAAKKKHMTVSQAAQTAFTAGTKELVLVHISPRYTYEDERTLKEQAQAHFPNACIGRGLQTFTVPLPSCSLEKKTATKTL